ncbi:MAG: thioredoxin family protein [Thermomicrobiales bacterium]
MKAELSVYIEEGCSGCDFARQLASQLDAEFANLKVIMVDIATIDSLPDEVVAVPAYVLNNRLASLGNPSVTEMEELIRRVVAGEVSAHGS